MKKLLLTLSLLTLSLTGCNNTNNKSNPIDVEGTKNETLKELARQTILGFSSLPSLNANVLAKRAFLEEEIEDVKQVLAEVDILLNDDSKLVAIEKESDREEYLNCLSLSFTMLNKKDEFTLYYNNLNVKEEIENDDFEQEVEKETSFKGIAIYNSLEYNFTYEMQEEIEDDENESESTFKLFLNTNNFIRIKQGFENESDENETYYSYSLVQDGHQIEEFKFSEEVENNKHHIELEKNNKKYRINYDNRDNEEVIRVALRNGKEETAIGYFRRVITTLEDDSISISYEFIE